MARGRRRSAKKKSASKDKSIALQDNLSHPVQTIFHLLAMMGVVESPENLLTRYQGADYNVSIALPLIKYAIAFDGDDTKGLEDDGWHIERVSYRDVEPFSRVFFAVDNARVAEMYSRADPNVKTTSIPEEKLMVEFKRRRMPEPDRNYKFTRDDGTELTVPDFTWEDYRIVFFMDGAYWHSVKDDQALIKEIKSSRKMQDTIVQKRKDKVRKDGAIRSELGARGWTVLTCTDDDISTAEGLKDVVDMVERAMETIASVRSVVGQKGSPSREDAESIMEFLDDSEDDATLDGGNGADDSHVNVSKNASEHTSRAFEEDGKVNTPDESTEALQDDSRGDSGDDIEDESISIIDLINSSSDEDSEEETLEEESDDGYGSLSYDEM